MIQETGVKSLVETYQGLKKWYLMPTGLIVSIISADQEKVEQSGEGSSTLPDTHLLKREPSGCPQIWLVNLQFFILIYIYIYIYVEAHKST